jgi:GNAT superfamily N-acetyltransferase
MSKRLLKKLVSRVVGAYEIYHVLAAPRLATATESARTVGFECVGDDLSRLDIEDPELAALGWYAGPGSVAYIATENGKVVGVACFWFAERYRRDRAFLALRDGEVKLVQVTVAAARRGQSIAPGLIAHAVADLRSRGVAEILSRVWWTHRASLSAFDKAGWRRIGLLAAFARPGREHAVRFVVGRELRRRERHCGAASTSTQ